MRVPTSVRFPMYHAVVGLFLLAPLVSFNADAQLAAATYIGSASSTTVLASDPKCTSPCDHGANLAAPGTISVSSPGPMPNPGQLILKSVGPSITAIATTSPTVTPGDIGSTKAQAIIDYFVEIVGPAGNVPVTITVSGGVSASNGYYIGTTGGTQAGVSIKVAQTGSPFYGTLIACASDPNNPYNQPSGCFQRQSISGAYPATFVANKPIAVELNALAYTYSYIYTGTYTAFIDPVFAVDPSFPNAAAYTVVVSPGITQAVGPGISPPTIAKSFGAASVVLNGSTSLALTLANPNGSASLTGVGFTDPLPAGLVVATPNGLSGSCVNNGVTTAVAGTTSISMANAALPANGSCTLLVNVTGIAAGTKNNTTTAVTSVEGGNGLAASASIVVLGNDANLSALKLSIGSLAPSFAPGTLVYTSSVGHCAGSITVTPTLEDPTASVKVNGASVVSGTPSAPISLAVGVNQIDVVVTAQDGATTQSYGVAVTRGPAAGLAPESIGVLSRKIHGTAGTMDLPLVTPCS